MLWVGGVTAVLVVYRLLHDLPKVHTQVAGQAALPELCLAMCLTKILVDLNISTRVILNA
jgi:hypothetical protein